MHQHFDTIERELKAGVDAGAGNTAELLERLERLLNDVRGARFAASFTMFGKALKPGADPEAEIEGVEPPPRKFKVDDTVRTKEGYLGRVAHYDRRNNVVVNVVFQACEYKESELRETDL
jgi:hypothetical protein